MAGKFSCDACGKTYSWKPELAGKRVKCKCGQPISIPASDPAGEDDIGDLGALAALSEGAATTPGAVPGGPTCPGCGSGVDPSAVICVNCGQNLKTGKKLKTSKVAAAAVAGGGAADAYAPGYRSYGAVNSEEGMTDKQKKLVIFSSIGGIAAVVLIIIFVVLPARAVKKRREAQIDARPAKLEHALTAMEESGGLVGAMKDGTLIGGGSPRVGVGTTVAGVGGGDPDAPPAVPPGYAFNERIQSLLAQSTTKVGKKFVLNPKAKFLGKTREQTEKVINDLYAMKCPSVQVLMTQPDMYTGDELAAGVVVVLPEDKAERSKVFAYYHTLEGTIEPLDMEPQSDKGQKWLSIEFRDPRGKR